MEVDVLIIGGGAAGLMAAYGAAQVFEQENSGQKTIVLEKMPRPARKIMITGKGRCNFTNVKNWNDFSPHICTDRNFLHKAFFNLNPEKVVEFFSAQGVESVIERGDRAYPASYKASDIVDALERAATNSGAAIECEKQVRQVSHDEDGYKVECADGSVYLAKSLVIATGGLSYPSTGSSGDGYIFAEDLGHTIKACHPALTALVPKGYKKMTSDLGLRLPKGLFNGHIDRGLPLTELGEQLCGCSLKNVAVTLKNAKDTVGAEFGDLDFTDGGIEGPVGFKLSRDAVKCILNGGQVKFIIDLKSAVGTDKLARNISTLIEEGFRDIKKLLRKLLPSDIAEAFLKTNPGLSESRSVNPKALAAALKEWTFDICGYVGYERCVVTAGGINTKEIIPKTMQSRVTPGLYMCGEVIDIDCDTGGYNLQCAFSTGFLAGQSAAKSILRKQS